MHTCIDSCTHSNQGVGSEEGLLGHTHDATHGATIQKRLSRCGQTGGYAFIHQCMNTFYPKVWDNKRGNCNMYNGPHRDEDVLHSYAKGVEQIWRVGWKSLIVLVDVHILTKVEDQKKCDWKMHAGSHRGAHLCAQLCKRFRTDMGSQVNVHLCTDGCIHSNKVWGQTQVHIFVHNYVKGVEQT